MAPSVGYKKKPRTHCLKNHELTDANTIIEIDGRRRCRTCDQIRGRAFDRRTGRTKGVRLQGKSKYSFLAPSSLLEMSEVELVWVAGWLEGEGCFQANSISGRLYAKIAAASTDLDTLERIQRITGVGNIRPLTKQKEHHKDCWIWQCQRFNDTVPLLKLLAPLMSVRRKETILRVISVSEEFRQRTS